MSKLIITEEEKSRILGMHKTRTSKHYLMEQETVPDSEWQQFGTSMMKEYVEKFHSRELEETKEMFKRLDKNPNDAYNQVYRENMSMIDKKLKDMGFPNGFQFKQPVLRNEFEELKNKWETTMK